jgi:hypothetical protein
VVQTEGGIIYQVHIKKREQPAFWLANKTHSMAQRTLHSKEPLRNIGFIPKVSVSQDLAPTIWRQGETEA